MFRKARDGLLGNTRWSIVDHEMVYCRSRDGLLLDIKPIVIINQQDINLPTDRYQRSKIKDQ